MKSSGSSNGISSNPRDNIAEESNWSSNTASEYPVNRKHSASYPGYQWACLLNLHEPDFIRFCHDRPRVALSLTLDSGMQFMKIPLARISRFSIGSIAFHITPSSMKKQYGSCSSLSSNISSMISSVAHRPTRWSKKHRILSEVCPATVKDVRLALSFFEIPKSTPIPLLYSCSKSASSIA